MIGALVMGVICYVALYTYLDDWRMRVVVPAFVAAGLVAIFRPALLGEGWLAIPTTFVYAFVIVLVLDAVLLAAERVVRR
ncbi:MAG TPA: hypothetical protein VF342_09795 [Alphaproteobacteria bacterium]